MVTVVTAKLSLYSSNGMVYIMSKYGFKSVAQVNVNETEVLRVSLNDDKGLPVVMKGGTSHMFLSFEQVRASIKSQGINPDFLRPFHMIQALKTASIECKLRFKTKGEDFIATQHTGQVLVGKKFVASKEGETYQVAETGVVIDYDESIEISHSMKTLGNLDVIAYENEAREIARVAAEEEAIEE